MTSGHEMLQVYPLSVPHLYTGQVYDRCMYIILYIKAIRRLSTWCTFYAITNNAYHSHPPFTKKSNSQNRVLHNAALRTRCLFWTFRLFRPDQKYTWVYFFRCYIFCSHALYWFIIHMALWRQSVATELLAHFGSYFY